MKTDLLIKLGKSHGLEA